MPGLAAVTSNELPPSNVRLVTVAALQPDSNWPAAIPGAASSTPLCRKEVRFPLVPLTVKTSPAPVSNVTLAAAEATWGAATTRQTVTMAGAMTVHSGLDRGRDT